MWQVHVAARLQHQLLPGGAAMGVAGHQGRRDVHHHQQERLHLPHYHRLLQHPPNLCAPLLCCLLSGAQLPFQKKVGGLQGSVFTELSNALNALN